MNRTRLLLLGLAGGSAFVMLALSILLSAPMVVQLMASPTSVSSAPTPVATFETTPSPSPSIGSTSISILLGAVIAGTATLVTAFLNVRNNRLTEERRWEQENSVRERQWEREDRFRFDDARRQAYADFLAAANRMTLNKPTDNMLREFEQRFFEISILARQTYVKDLAEQVFHKITATLDHQEDDDSQREALIQESVSLMHKFMVAARRELAMGSVRTELFDADRGQQ